MDPHDIGVSPVEPTTSPQHSSLEWKRFFRMHPRLRWVLGIAGISFGMSLIVIGLVVAVGWRYRDRIAALLIATLPSQEPLPTIAAPVTTSEGTTHVNEAQKDLTVTEVVAKVNPSVVSIEVKASNGVFTRTVGKGTGFFVTTNGYLVTNRHVVDRDDASFAITTAAGKEYTATLVAKDPVFDLAVLKVAGSGFPAVTLGDSRTLALGQSVVAIGFALGEFENSISVGVVSGLGRSIVASGGGSTEQLDRVIQTDAAINPGNSGGPLINMKGEVVGVNVAVAQGSQNIGFSIPSENVRQVVDSVKAYGYIVRPFVGVTYSQIDEAVQARLGLSVAYGVLVGAVSADSPASRAGIQSQDIILSIDGTKLDGEPTFSTVIRGKKVGQKVVMVILRDGSQRTITVQLAQAPNS